MMAESINCGVIHSIADLGPDSNNWVIKACVLRKTPIRISRNQEGKLFSMVLKDKSGEIRAVVFRKEINTYYPKLEVNKVYFISKCEIKSANPYYNVLNSFYELIFTQETNVIKCEDAGDIPDIQCSFSPISKIANMEPVTAVDVIGVCTDTGTREDVTNKEYDYDYDLREITLVDSTCVNIQLKLWNDEALDFAVREGDIVLVKGARLKEYEEENYLSCYFESILRVNPDIPEAHILRGWYNKDDVEMLPSPESYPESPELPCDSDTSGEVDEIHDAVEKRLGLEIKPEYS